MDQNSTNGTDKRNWRERLGIGAGSGGKEMPRIADEFVPPAQAARAAVKPAPMAPRGAMKAAPPRAAAAESEKLADKLKAQRDAQERLAEQRVQAAKSRAEIKPGETGVNGSNGAKPKFTFANEEPAADASKPSAKASLPVPPPPRAQAPSAGQVQRPQAAGAKPTTQPITQSRPVVPPPVITTPPLTPPRQPLGAARPSTQSPIVPPRPQQRFSPPPSGYQPTGGYGAQVPPYRPMEPGARGYGAGNYSPPSTYVPPVGGYNNQPRLPVPPARGADYGADAYDARARHLRPPPRPSVGYRDDYGNDGDIFDDPRATRRTTAGEYSQAYRDAEQGYEEDLPPSRGPWIPLLLLLVLLGIGFAAAMWLYQNGTSGLTGQTGQNAPVVQAPAQPATTTPEPQAQPAAQPSKKLIYDRIVGDREVLGGDVIDSEEVPAQPADQNLQGGDPAQGVSDPVQPTGQDELVPLPLPPPPGEDGDQQGAAPSNKTSNEAMITPAASESQAAVPSQDVAQKTDAAVAKSDQPLATGLASGESLPVPGEPVPVPGESIVAVAAPEPSPGSEAIETPAPEPEPVVVAPKKKIAEAQKTAAKKAEKSLGAEPVVLVPPADGTEPALGEQVAILDDGVANGANGGGLYGGEGVVEPGTPTATIAPAPAPATAKKKKTLADLFRNSDDEQDQAPAAAIAEPAPAPVQKVQAPKPQPTPPPQQVASVGGYVVQLASFPNQSDASKEYGRLKAKHGGALSGLAPIVTQATVGGSIRYRLAVGTMTTREQASAVCAKLFAAGERDCLVRRQ